VAFVANFLADGQALFLIVMIASGMAHSFAQVQLIKRYNRYVYQYRELAEKGDKWAILARRASIILLVNIPLLLFPLWYRAFS
jgi:hypothetical protein